MPYAGFRSFGADRYVAGENDWIVGTSSTARRLPRRPLVFCHPSGGTATTVGADAYFRAVLDTLGQDFTVGVGDLGGETWGNDTGTTRVGQMLDYLQSSWNTQGPAVLVGVSMGGLTVLNYALRYPQRVAAVVACLPALDLADVRTRDASFPALIDAAYGGAYNDATDGPTHSPVQFAASLPANLPVGLWGSSDDIYAVPATFDAFTAARPNTYRENLGALGHTPFAVFSGLNSIQRFVRSNAK